MFSKRGRPWEAESVPADQRLRANLADLFVSNDVSAARAQTLFADGEASGAKHMSDLAKAGNYGKLGKNLCRDITGKLLTHSRWPSTYNAQVRTWSQKNRAGGAPGGTSPPPPRNSVGNRPGRAHIRATSSARALHTRSRSSEQGVRRNGMQPRESIRPRFVG